jgi:8-amino-7-oxononanoate synthase
MNRVDTYLAARLAERIAAGNLKRLPVPMTGIDFRSNDYLGIATNGLLTLDIATMKNWSGSTGSRMIAGNDPYTEELEARIAAFHRAEAGILFNSGYDANTGLLAAIAGKHTTYIYDELCHASIIDGIRQSICRNKYRFAHNDADALEAQLKKAGTEGQVIVVIESVYSMDGDTAPLEAIVRLCEQYDAQLVVDEAHATGVIGTHGEGLVGALGLQGRVFARVHTFGKALGCHGAVVVGSNLLRDYLINFARSLIFTTALPGHSVATIGKAYEYISSPDFSNQSLHDLIAYFRQKIEESGIDGFIDSQTTIQALVTGGNEYTRGIAMALQQAGLLINPILYPTVPQGTERLRICLHSFNTREQVDMLFEHLSDLVKTGKEMSSSID